MSRILIVYASNYGQTRRIAGALADRFRQRGHTVESYDIGDADVEVPAPAGYDAVVLGSRIQLGRHARSIGQYVRTHRAALFDVPTAFFSVSMAASDPRAGTDPNAYLRVFFELLAWHPTHAVAFGGGLPYRQYGWFLRFVMKQISRAAGHTTDTSRDHDCTDWAAVARFADEIAEDLQAPIVALPVARARERARA